MCPHDSTKDAFVQLLVRLVATCTSSPELPADPTQPQPPRMTPAMALLDAVLPLLDQPPESDEEEAPEADKPWSPI